MIVSKAKTIEGSSATNKAGGWKGTGRRTIGQEKNNIYGKYLELGGSHGSRRDVNSRP